MHRPSAPRPIAAKSLSSFARLGKPPVSEVTGSIGRDPFASRPREYSSSIRDGIPLPAAASRVTGLMAGPVPAANAVTKRANTTRNCHPSRSGCMPTHQSGWPLPISRASAVSPIYAAGLGPNASSGSAAAPMRGGRKTGIWSIFTANEQPGQF